MERPLFLCLIGFRPSGKRDLVVRDVVYHSTCQGGFGRCIVPIQGAGAFSLVGPTLRYGCQCVGPHDYFWLFDRLGVDPQTLLVLATPSLFLLTAAGLPVF